MQAATFKQMVLDASVAVACCLGREYPLHRISSRSAFRGNRGTRYLRYGLMRLLMLCWWQKDASALRWHSYSLTSAYGRAPHLA
jgi:hypothetical protein